MAKTRMINTRFWNDGYIAELGPLEKLLFLYFLTNQHTDICGVYELPIRTMVFDTGIEEETVRNVLSRFAVDEKVEYVDGWVIVKNFLKHQHKTSPTVAQGIARSLKEIPESIRARIGYPYPIDTQPHSDLDLDSDLNSDSREASPPIPVFERKIREKDEEYRDLVKDLASKDYLSLTQINDIVLTEFLPYWLERGEGAKKARWEKEKAFDYLRRLRTWIKKYHEHYTRKDIQCRAAGAWHRKGETCHHEKPEPDYKKAPVSEYARDLGAGKRITSSN